MPTHYAVIVIARAKGEHNLPSPRRFWSLHATQDAAEAEAARLFNAVAKRTLRIDGKLITNLIPMVEPMARPSMTGAATVEELIAALRAADEHFAADHKQHGVARMVRSALEKIESPQCENTCNLSHR